uniref:Ornithine decarboxylase antizyme 3 n=1 Tax=Bos mutus grunniens TaxID=30521 RepID=A0A8C0A416_BOSMU
HSGPVAVFSAPESLVGLQGARHTEQGDQDQLKELYSAGNLTVLSTDPLLHKDPVQLDFHFRLTPQTSAHWHGLLCDHRLFLDIPYRALDQGNWESLTAALQYVEEKTNVDSVFVNIQNNRNDRGGESALSFLALCAEAADSNFPFIGDLPPLILKGMFRQFRDSTPIPFSPPRKLRHLVFCSFKS